MLEVTVDIFSGRPNPSWVLDEDDAKKILKELTDNRGVISDLESGHLGLGYRGVQIHLSADDEGGKLGLPESFVIAGGGSEDEAKGLKIAKKIVEGMSGKPAALDSDEELTPLDDSMRDFILGEMEAFSAIPLDEMAGLETESEDDVPMIRPEEEEPSDVTCRIELGTYNPGFWNNNAYVRRNNNCYNYGRNWKTNTFAQPGRASGDYPYPLTCDRVIKAALSDGAHKRFHCFPDSERPRWLMAMVVWPGRDYHWYRKHKGNFWGHKPGSTAAKRTDNRGRIIVDPRTCDRGPYTNFCSYFYACKSMRIR